MTFISCGRSTIRNIFLFLAFALGAAAQAPETPANPPNILFITVDTLRADHLSAYGYHLKTSPRIDQLAAAGVRFENAYCTIPLTGPSHISMFTSRFPQEHGARINGVAPPEKTKFLFLPQVLRKHGYTNGAFISAWPLTSRLTHLARWFDTYDEKLTRNYQLFNSSRYAEDVTPPAIAWVKNNKSKPFFLWVHYFDPHSPYHLREEFASPEKIGEPPAGRPAQSREMQQRIRKYDSEIGYADHYIGKLLDTLTSEGLEDNTIVVLTADHGESLGEHGYVGHGRQLYEPIVRVPLIVRYPARVPAGKVIEQPVSSLDLTPTMLELSVGLASPEMRASPFGGRSVAKAIESGERIYARPVRYVSFAGKKGFAPTWVSWLWVKKDNLPLHVGMTEGSRKLIWTPRDEKLAIFNIERDPFEIHPALPESGGESFVEHTEALEKWYLATDLSEGESKLTERDMEVLKTLGYIQ